MFRNELPSSAGAAAIFLLLERNEQRSVAELPGKLLASLGDYEVFTYTRSWQPFQFLQPRRQCGAVLPRSPLLPPLFPDESLSRPATSFASAAFLPALILSQPRLVNIIMPGFYFHDFFTSSRADVGILAAATAFYDRVAFSLSKYVKFIYGNVNEFIHVLIVT